MNRASALLISFSGPFAAEIRARRWNLKLAAVARSMDFEKNQI